MNLKRLVEENLWMIVTTIVSGLLAYAIGTTRTGDRLERLETEVRAAQAFDACAVRHFDLLDRGEHGTMPCQLQ